MRLARPTATVAVGLLFALGSSCGRTVEPLDEGVYAVTVNGSIAASGEGRAGFGILPTGWGISLMPREPGGDGWTVRLDRNGPPPRAGDRLPVGAVVRDGDPVESYPYATALVGRYLQPGPGTLWDGQSGWIRILRATPERLVGTFELTAVPYSDDAPGPITVIGRFSAVCFLDAGC
jgi:hypothetical protein